MLYLKNFSFLPKEREEGFFIALKRTCYSMAYPFGLFPQKGLTRLEFEPVTILFGVITFRGRTYERIGYEWIQYIAQLDDSRALSIGLRDLDCVPGTMPDIILNNMTFK